MIIFGDHPTCPDCGSIRIPVRKGSKKLRCVNGCEVLRRVTAALDDNPMGSPDEVVGSVVDELTQEAERLGMYENAETIAKRAQPDHPALHNDLAKLQAAFDATPEELGLAAVEQAMKADCDPDIWEEWPDVEFLDYVESHSRTPLALFHYDMILRFERLAGQRVRISGAGAAKWVSVPYESIKELLIKARVRSNGGES